MYTFEYLVYHLRPFGTTSTDYYNSAATTTNTSTDDVGYARFTASRRVANTAANSFMKSESRNVSAVKQSSQLFNGTDLTQTVNRQTDSVDT